MKNSQNFREFIKDAVLRTKNGKEYLVGLYNCELQAVEVYTPDKPNETIQSYFADEIFDKDEISNILNEIAKYPGE